MNTEEIADALAEYKDAEGTVLSAGDEVYWNGVLSRVVGFEDRKVLIAFTPVTRKNGPEMRLAVASWRLRKRKLR